MNERNLFLGKMRQFISNRNKNHGCAGDPMTTETAIAIRPFAPGDYAAWLALWQGYQAFYQVAIPESVSRLTFARFLDAKEPMFGAVAVSENAALGLVHCIRHRSAWTEGDACYLQDLFVAPARRGTGIGRRLIEYVYETAAREGMVRVHWLTHETNATAIRLYDTLAERTRFVFYRHNLGSGMPSPQS